MSNFFDTVRSLQESNWERYAPQLSNTAHDASRTARDYQSHTDAANEHGHAEFAHSKSAESLPPDTFAHKYHKQMAAHHGAMGKLHTLHAKNAALMAAAGR